MSAINPESDAGATSGALLVGLGVATPASTVSQREALLRARTLSAPPDENSARFMTRIYESVGVESRGVVAPGFFEGPTIGPQGPGTASRMAQYAAHAPALAQRAARDALADASLDDPRSVTHLIVVSCTGFAAPGLDIALLGSLGLKADVRRTQIGFMGCHGAINGLRVAESIVSAEPSAVVLVVCVELCSLHFRWNAQPDQVIANALFADGAAACVVVSSWSHPAKPIGRLASSPSIVLPDSSDAMAWTVGDHGFEMALDAGLPDLLQIHTRAWCESFLAPIGLSPASIASWAIHPGGPRVVRAIAAALGLHEEAIAPTLAVLRRHGNMSSPTVLFVLDELRRSELRMPCVAMSFGPGIAAEAIVLREC